ncbi:hypothetical protein BSKO_03209 [Bryopsis sp. KO-2023]|nr:hypothetical protein BSKO_03209 [Bryopsis sp. KO-2023]
MGWLDALINWLRRLFLRKEMELSLIGLQNAGKTSLVDVLSSGDFKEDMIPTVGFNMRKVSKGGVVIKLWDLGGQPRFRGMWERYCRGVQAIVFVVDAADTDSIDDATRELHALLERPSLTNIPVLVVGNKIDINDAMGTEELIGRMNLKGLGSREVAVYSISCKKKTNVHLVLEWLTKHAK